MFEILSKALTQDRVQKYWDLLPNPGDESVLSTLKEISNVIRRYARERAEDCVYGKGWRPMTGGQDLHSIQVIPGLHAQQEKTRVENILKERELNPKCKKGMKFSPSGVIGELLQATAVRYALELCTMYAQEIGAEFEQDEIFMTVMYSFYVHECTHWNVEGQPEKRNPLSHLFEWVGV